MCRNSAGGGPLATIPENRGAVAYPDPTPPAAILGGIAIDINQVGILLLGAVIGWFLLFAVRRYKVQWGAFAAFFAIGFGVSLISFLYVRDLLAYYGIGIFLGFVANMIVRVAGGAAGGKLGEGLLEISAFRTHEK